MSGSAARAAAILGDIMVLAWARRLLRTFREPRPRPATYTYRSDLSALRAVVREHAQRAGLPPVRVGDLVLAVSEVAANTLRHTHSPGTLAIWHDADEIVCEVRDEGVIADPLAGRRTPPPGALSGHGLWLVHQVCDRVELRSCASGTVVRMRMAVHEQQGSGLRHHSGRPLYKPRTGARVTRGNGGQGAFADRHRPGYSRAPQRGRGDGRVIRKGNLLFSRPAARL